MNKVITLFPKTQDQNNLVSHEALIISCLEMAVEEFGAEKLATSLADTAFIQEIKKMA
jgi:hypothetical protein